MTQKKKKTQEKKMTPREKVLNWMDKNHINAKQLAILAGLPHSVLYNFLNGKTHIRRLTAVKLIEATKKELTLADLEYS